MNQFTTDEIARMLKGLLCDMKLQPSEALDAACNESSELGSLVQLLFGLRIFTSALSQGNLDVVGRGTGYVMGNLKALQANLQHLVWQMAHVSQGDFAQRVDFLGDFSSSFNSMCERLQQYSELLSEQARVDALTRLANRTHIDQYLDALFEDAQKTGSSFSVMMIDIDFFKRVNDTYGHDVGDVVLTHVAAYLKGLFRDSDFVGRYGGEEFIAVLPKITQEQAQQSAARVLKRFNENPIQVNEQLVIPITVSIGVSQLLPGESEPTQVIKRSDNALYLAKNNGRNRAEFL